MMQPAQSVLRVATAAALVAVSATAAHAQSIDPSSVDRTISVGETITINKTITLGPGGATTVDLFFLADNTGSMGSIVGRAETGAEAILAGLPASYRFGVGRYLGDPSEPGVTPAQAYAETQALTFDKDATETAIGGWFASGGGDGPEANFFALEQVANTAAWRAEAQRLVVWFGDVTSHTATTTQAEAIAALQAANAKVIAFNSGPGGSGIDGGGQASGIVAGAGGTLVNSFLSITDPEDFVDVVSSQIEAATSTIDLVFGSTFLGSGLSLGFTCTDPEGCLDVEGGESRTFDLTITGLEPGDYSFNVFAQGVDAIESDRIRVVGEVVPEPATMILLGTGLLGLGLAARRRKDEEAA